MTAEDRRRFNARKHGLATDVCRDPSAIETVENLINTFLGADRPTHLIEAARELAAAVADFQRIDRAKETIIGRCIKDRNGSVEQDQVGAGEVDRNVQMDAYLRAIPELAKIERYERRAASRFRRAFQRYALAEEKVLEN
jgi:hypothetical protein